MQLNKNKDEVQSLKDLLRLAKSVPVVFRNITPLEKPVTFFLALKGHTAEQALAKLHEIATTNVFHQIARTRHSDLLRVELVSANDRPKLEEIAAGWASVHKLDPFLKRREKNMFLILDYDFPEEMKLTRESAREILVRQNPIFTNVEVTRLFTDRPQGLVFGVRDVETAEKVVKQRFVNFGPFRPIATRYSPIRMCMNCYSYTHEGVPCRFLPQST